MLDMTLFFGGKTIFLLLVDRNSVSRFLDSHRAESCGFSQSSSRHRFADSIDLCLIEFRHLSLRAMSRLNQIARLLH